MNALNTYVTRLNKMATSDEDTLRKGKKSHPVRNSTLESQEEYISGEELYTEGSSDEDDMALRIRRRERHEVKKQKQGSCVSVDDSNCNLQDEHFNHNVTYEQEQEDKCYRWRPSQGSLKLKQSSDPEKSASSGIVDGAARGAGLTPVSLSEAYSTMHKLDAQLRDSERRLKEAQAETLQAQLATRAQLRELRERAGGHNVVLARNLDAFMHLCPTVDFDASRADGTRGAERGAEGGGGDQGYSVLPRIGGADSESDDSESSSVSLAITDEEKLKLAALLRDLDQERDEARAPRTPGLSGYLLDAEARRNLGRIDDKLQELVPPDASEAASGSGSNQAPSLAKGAPRHQRLEDIDQCLQALADAALEDVEPLGEAEMRALLEEARLGQGGQGEGGDGGEGAPGPTDPLVISGLLDEARREMPRFRFHHHEDAEDGADTRHRAQRHAVGR